jgi:hypothetical protein
VHKQAAADDETIASNVRDTLDKLRQSQSSALAGKRLLIHFILCD